MNNRGFTLIETFVAVSVLLVALTGTLTVAARALEAANYAKDQVTASYLAQEGVEYVRYVRDDNGLQGLGWLNGLSPCMNGASCTVDSPASAIAACSATCPPLRYDPATGFYGYNSSWSASQFTRKVSISQISSYEIVVSVNIAWTTGKFSRTFTIQENLLNWR